jgi:amidohydrolase
MLRAVFAFALALSLSHGPAAAEPLPDMIAKVSATVDGDADRLVEMFKDIHANPELGFTEVRTSGIVATELTTLGFEVTTGIAGTGVVGVFRNGPGKTIWYRADMDANAVREETGVPHAATSPQKLPDGTEQWAMHACGHDAHTVWMLGAAKALVTLKDGWSGTLVVYAQPAEEPGTGAQAMLDDGLLTRGFPAPDLGMGAHSAPGPLGFVASASGPRWAGMDQLDITFTGIGGHGSTPNVTIDPIVMAAQAIMGYQTIISRSIDPQASAVITVGAVEAGRDNNVIPQTATLKLNLRWFSEAVRQQLLDRIDTVNRGVAIAAGVAEDKMPVRTMKGTSSVLINDPALVETVNAPLRQFLGEGKVIDTFPAVMGSEDFQMVMNAAGVPYVFPFIGIADPERFAAAQAAGRPVPFANHNPDYEVDLRAIPLGTKINVLMALGLFAS